MGIRDVEIARIEKYAEGLGATIVWKKHKRGDPCAEWNNEGAAVTITLYVRSRRAKVDIIFDLIHELAHHLAWIAAGRSIDPSVDKAYKTMEQNKATKKIRRVVYETERADSEYQRKVYDDVGIKIPWWKVELNRRLDVWTYERWYVTGKNPTVKASRKKRKELFALLKPQ